MSDFDNPYGERMSKMPWVTAACAGAGLLLGVAVAAMIAIKAQVVPRIIFPVCGAIGFVLGVVVGVTLDTLVFKPLRDKREKRERKRRRQREKQEGRWQS